jgi:hypothetical protein
MVRSPIRAPPQNHLFVGLLNRSREEEEVIECRCNDVTSFGLAGGLCSKM